MDAISLLPVEIAQNIFQYLNVKDLFSCMAVCNVWRNIINTNYVWGRFYRILKIEEMLDSDDFTDNDVPKPLNSLCTRAIELKKYLSSPGSNWRNGRSNDFYFNLKYRQWDIFCYEPYFVIAYLSVKELHVFRCLQNSLECIDVISVNLPLTSLEQPILLNKKYIILSAFNVTLVYKLTDGHFKFYKAFVLKDSKNICSTDNEFNSFIQENCLSSPTLYERVLVDNMLWISDVSGIKHIIDLDNNIHSGILTLLIHTKVVQHSQYVINYLENNISISNPDGTTVSTFIASCMDNTFYMNESIICCLAKVIENEWFTIECRDILSGKILRKLTAQEKTKVTLHPKKSIMYLLSTHSEFFSVASLCIETGNSLWNYEVRSGPHMFWGSFLYVVNNRFLLVYPAPCSDDLFALFNLKGKLLYENTVSNGILLYFTDSIMLFKEEGRLHFTTFF